MEDMKEKEIQVPPMAPEPLQEQLLFHQLRSLGLKALCCLLQQPEAVQLILEEKHGNLRDILPHLLTIATRPTDLDQYRSVEFLEEQEERLSEMLHDQPLQWNDRIPKSASQLTQKQLLKYSPFRTLQVHLPSRLDTESAMGVLFSQNHEFRIMFKKQQHHLVGYCRTNNMIPLSIPLYYFEAKIVKLGQRTKHGNGGNDTSSSSSKTDNAENNWRVAIGLWREGMNFQGDCGDESSYAFGASGFVYSTVSRKRVSTKWSDGFVEGDVIGVCWNQREKTIFFTRNGEMVNSKHCFDQVNGQFYPMVWLQGDGAQVSVNLGQEQMQFNLDKWLNPSQLQQLKKENQVQYSEAEIRRRTMAEELVRMMGDMFPLQFAVVTLEQCHDDLALAADYLVNNASREFDRIAQNISRNTARREAYRGEHKDDNKYDAEVDAEESGLMAFIASNVNDAGNGNGNGNGNGAGDNLGRGGARAGGMHGEDNLLDDEVDARLPVGLTLEEIAPNADIRHDEEIGADVSNWRANAGAPNEEEDSNSNHRRQIGIGSRLREQLPPIQLQKIHTGQYLSIWSDAHRICHDFWPKYWKRLQGNTGIVHSVDVNNSLE
ncbi:ran-binding protein [Reticulomyxa filosa]|uniref:Ran-binding protein n=1 Tax=Reticulomyxa filosa TaxID=46433 RepID=X6NK38_RETFI|nr:ran-binding protein [Reticulomyxa filosa]|eukprot:ETO26336.1 ran-binding protein [Reticulomyxa filosa]